MESRVTLVVDDGPSDATFDLLSMLEKHGHRAVLFVLGCNVKGRENTLVSAIQRGFHLGNHTFHHERFSEIDVTQGRASIEKTEALIDAAYAAAGVARPGRWFRFPFLDAGGDRLTEFQTLLSEMGFERPACLVAWGHDPSRLDWPTTICTRDWELPDAEVLRQRVQKAGPGDIVEFHDKPDYVRLYGGALAEELFRHSLQATVPSPAGTYAI